MSKDKIPNDIWIKAVYDQNKEVEKFIESSEKYDESSYEEKDLMKESLTSDLHKLLKANNEFIQSSKRCVDPNDWDISLTLEVILEQNNSIERQLDVINRCICGAKIKQESLESNSIKELIIKESNSIKELIIKESNSIKELLKNE